MLQLWHGLLFVVQVSKETLAKPCINFPVELCSYVLKNRLSKEFLLFVALQLKTDGVVLKSEATIIATRLPGQKSEKTRRRLFKNLLSYKWVGYDKKKELYWIRSIDIICKAIGISGKHKVRCGEDDLMHFKSFLSSAVLSRKLNAQKAAIFLSKRKYMNSAVKKKDAALQNSYTGFSLNKIAEIFDVSRAEASRIKTRGECDGYLDTRKKHSILCRLPKRDFCLKKFTSAIDPELGKKIFFKTDWKTGEVLVCVQKHDEITPRMVIKKIKG